MGMFRLLSENPSLLQLYRDLVITQVISPEEFWTQHASKYTNKQNSKKQDVGVSGAFLVSQVGVISVNVSYLEYCITIKEEF